MPLRPDELEQVIGIATEIAKEETEAMGKMLVADIMDLQAKIDDLEAKSAKLKELAEELGRQIRNLKPEKPKEPEKPVSRSFSKK